VKSAYRLAVAGFGVTFLGIGVALIVVTAAHGGGIGYLLGALFVAAGTARLVILRRGTRL
jgi:hypothetical protein